MFFSSPETEHSILALTGKSRERLSSSDVIQWSIEQTCLNIESLQPLRCAQGTEFVQRGEACQALFKDNENVWAAILTSERRFRQFWRDIREPEQRPLIDLYGIAKPEGVSTRSFLDGSWHPFASELIQAWKEIPRACFVFEASVAEEQERERERERELAPEVERQPQIQNPPRPTPATHRISDDLKAFIKSGSLQERHDSDLRSAFGSLKPAMPTKQEQTDGMKSNGTSFVIKVVQKSGKKGKGGKNRAKTSKQAGDQRVDEALDLHSVHPELFVTTDFCKMFETSQKGVLRPVRWVLSSTTSKDILVIISPFEAAQLLPMISRSTAVRLHLYAPRISRTTKNLSDLRFLVFSGATEAVATSCWPSNRAISGLNLFSGSLYLRSMNDYHNFANYLGIRSGQVEIELPEGSIYNDGFVPPETRELLQWPVESPFYSTPILFMKALLGLRMHGQSFAHTHLGYIVNGQLLQNASFKGMERSEQDLGTLPVINNVD